MAQTGYTPISIYYSSTASNTPTAGNLVAGELAINTADGKLFYKDSAGVVQVIGTKGGVGSSTTTQVLYNSSGLVVGSANLTFNGTTLTVANDASISGLTVGKGGGAQADNIAIGVNALAVNTGASNMGVGYFALKANTSGARNAAFGVQAMALNTTGNYNSAFGGEDSVGYPPLYSNTTGSSNTAIGSAALALNTTASFNTATGYQAGYSNTTGDICAFGSFALKSNTTGVGNVAFGGYGNGTGLYAALQTNTTGSYNVAVGNGCLQGNTTGDRNTALGHQAGYNNTTSSYNTYIGHQCGYSVTSATFVTFVGQGAGYSTTSGVNSTYLGQGAGYSVTTGSYNTFVGARNNAGYGAGELVSTGSGNTLLGGYNGNSGGLDIRTADGYVVLSDGYGNWKAYFNGAAGGWYQTSNSATWSITSDARIKKNIAPLENGLSTILALQPKEFDYIIGNKHDVGFIAQDYELVLPLQTTEQDASGEYAELTGGDKVKGIQQNLVPYLVKAIQELKAEFDAYKATHP